MKNKKPDLVAARLAARRLTSELNIASPQQIILEDIAMAVGVFVLEAELQGAEARLLRKGKSGIIRLKADIPEPGRKRFAIAHELGHWEIHRNAAQLSICTADDIGGYDTLDPEIEANAFAGELLMPTKLMWPRCSDAAPDLSLVCRLADEFHTTVSATAVRFVEECKETCVVVFSENRMVKWWRAPEYAPVWIERGLPIDRRSSAWAPTGPGPMERIATEAWFPDLHGQGRREVHEQSMVLGHYGTVLTLLWLTELDDDEGEEEDDSQWSRSIGSTLPSWKRQR